MGTTRQRKGAVRCPVAETQGPALFALAPHSHFPAQCNETAILCLTFRYTDSPEFTALFLELEELSATLGPSGISRILGKSLNHACLSIAIFKWRAYTYIFRAGLKVEGGDIK